MIFPIEVWENVFGHCEAKDLIRFKSVCKLWAKMIPRALKGNDKWYKQCIKDIPKSELSMILEKIFPYSDGVNFEPYRNESKRWEGVHISWRNWKRLSRKTTCFTEKIFCSSSYELETITCIATSSSLIAAGSSDGFIRFYNMYELCNKKREPIYTADHTEYVCDVKILEYDDHLIGISVSRRGSAKFWDLVQGTMLFQQPADVISVSHGYSYLVKGKVLSKINLLSTEIYVLGDMFPTINADLIFANKNELFLWSSSGSNLQLNFTDASFTEHETSPLETKFGRFQAFQCGVSVFISFNGLLYISVNFGEWIEYKNITSILNARPTCVYYYCNIFIIGLDVGDIYIYHVDNANHLKSMDFNPQNAQFKVEIDESWISSLDIMEHEKEQFIIAACDKFLHIIKLYF